MGQMASLLTERQRGALPSNSEVNPRQEGNEHVKAVILRSGKELAALGQPPVIGEVETEEVIHLIQTDKVEQMKHVCISVEFSVFFIAKRHDSQSFSLISC